MLLGAVVSTVFRQTRAAICLSSKLSPSHLFPYMLNYSAVFISIPLSFFPVSDVFFLSLSPCLSASVYLYLVSTAPRDLQVSEACCVFIGSYSVCQLVSGLLFGSKLIKLGV